MRSKEIAFAALMALVFPGCMSWTRGWEPMPSDEASGPDITVEEADRRFAAADDVSDLERVIEAYTANLTEASSPLHLHTRLAEAHVLYGAAYANSRAEKRRHYELGLRHAERAMATNREFRERVESDASVAEASRSLGEAEMEAMLIWVTGVSYYFKEGLSIVGKVMSFRTISETREVLDRLMELDPEFENGAVPFSLAIHYIARPPWAGRDIPRARELFDQAVSISPDSLLIRWGRAKYLHARTGDERAFREDLEWVVERDPREAATPYRWNVYFQRQAEQMLNELEERG
ncbi:MAG: TRAP transporter TatT component family protein [Thermoanaerobaculia bacterium]|nr:TRAP transporter TatT component family protein [Thermoanaerobaculia bacterium]